MLNKRGFHPIVYKEAWFLTVYNHRFLHEIFIYEAANFAPIHPTQLGSWFENFDGSVFSELI